MTFTWFASVKFAAGNQDLSAGFAGCAGRKKLLMMGAEKAALASSASKTRLRNELHASPAPFS